MLGHYEEEILTPSYHGELCRHNGENPEFEIACDECDYYLFCFPDWKNNEIFLLTAPSSPAKLKSSH